MLICDVPAGIVVTVLKRTATTKVANRPHRPGVCWGAVVLVVLFVQR